MREDGGEVGEAGEDDEGVDEGVEGGLGAEVDAGEDGGDEGAEEDGVEGVAVLGAHAAEGARERRRVVACQGPEDPAGGQVAAEDGDQVRENGDDE